MNRRQFLWMGSGAMMNALAQSGGNYKALVCIFLFGGNDGNNTVIPQSAAEYNAYKAVRGSLALPDTNTQLLPIVTAKGTPYALNSGLASIHPLWAQGKLTAVANVGMLAQPTTRPQYLAGSAPVPSNLFSHSDQVIQMQTATPGGSGGTGWGGRVADAANSLNGASTFPASVSMSGPAIYCTGNVVQSASLIPGFNTTPYGMNIWPPTAATARMQGLQEVLTFDSGLAVIQAANKVRQDALNLSALLNSVTSGPALTQLRQHHCKV